MTTIAAPSTASAALELRPLQPVDGQRTESGSPVADQEAHAIGGKAAGLLRCLRAGVRVPATLVIPAACLGLRVGGSGAHDGDSQAFAERMAIPDAGWDGIAAQVRARLGPGPWAVRSSATLEDAPDASWAGIFATTLDVMDADLPAAIARCHASLWSDRSRSMHRRLGRAMADSGMAVIIQPLVEAVMGGVLVTADPARGVATPWQLSAVAGGCRGLVDGTAPALTAAFDPDAATMTVLAAPPGAPACPGRLAEALVAAGRRLLGRDQRQPLDIEWCWDGELLWILQARALAGWRERLAPESVQRDETATGHWRLLSPHPFTPYAGAVRLSQLAGRRDGTSTSVMRLDCVQDVAIRSGYLYGHPRPLERQEERRRAWVTEMEAYPPLGENPFQHQALPLLARLDRAAEACARMAPQPSALARWLDIGLEYAYEASRLHWTTAWENADSRTVQEFRAWITRLDPGLHPGAMDVLLEVDNRLSDERQLLLRMAAQVHAHNALVRLFAGCSDDHLCWERVPKLAGGSRLLLLVAEHGTRFGDLAPSYDFSPAMDPRMGEEPALALSAMRPLLALDAARLLAAVAERAVERAATQRRLVALLPIDERYRFLAALHQARQAVAVSPDHHAWMDRRYRVHARSAMVAVGAALHAAGWLEAAADAEFCTPEQLTAGLGGQDLRAIAASGRERHREHRRLLPPSALGDDPAAAAAPEHDAQAPALAAAAAAPAQVRGIANLAVTVRAPVVHGVPAHLERPSVLVLSDRFSDYQHLLGSVAAIVLDHGSPFDHQGMLAREAGILAIYQTRTASTSLRPGQWVEVDGSLGLVRAIEP